MPGEQAAQRLGRRIAGQEARLDRLPHRREPLGRLGELAGVTLALGGVAHKLRASRLERLALGLRLGDSRTRLLDELTLNGAQRRGGLAHHRALALARREHYGDIEGELFLPPRSTLDHRGPKRRRRGSRQSHRRGQRRRRLRRQRDGLHPGTQRRRERVHWKLRQPLHAPKRRQSRPAGRGQPAAACAAPFRDVGSAKATSSSSVSSSARLIRPPAPWPR